MGAPGSTPGPWRADISGAEACVMSEVADQGAVVLMPSWQADFRAERDANTHQFAASGDLYDALVELRDWVSDAAERKSYFSQADASIVEIAQADLEKIDAALSKAEGRS